MTLFPIFSITALVIIAITVTTSNAFTFIPVTITNHPVVTCRHPSSPSSSLQMNLMNDVTKFFKSFTQTATASHILVKDSSAEGAAQLQEMKEKIGNDPVLFAEYAAEFSTCPTGKKGGDLGEFRRGVMVKPFDEVVFSQELGVVHGPVKTPYGHHLILIKERSDID